MAVSPNLRGTIDANTGVIRGQNRAARGARMRDALAVFGADRRTKSGKLTKAGRRAMRNASRRATLGGNGG